METVEEHPLRTHVVRQIKDLDENLKHQLSEKGSINNKKYMEIREQLQRLYEQAILDELLPSDVDGESQMWKTCFYKVIEEFRRSIRNLGQIITESENNSDNRRMNTSIQEQTKSSFLFHAFLESSTGFYFNLLARLRSKYHLSLDRSIQSLDISSDSPTFKRLFICFRLLIRLGDLARYQKDLARYNGADWQAAWTHYLDAQKLLPEHGMPCNQLAVLCTYTHDNIGALYYYSRSLSIQLPSDTAKSNIEVLMRNYSFSKFLEKQKKFMERNNAQSRGKQSSLNDDDSASNSDHRSPTRPPERRKFSKELWTIFVECFFGIHSTDPSSFEPIASGSTVLVRYFKDVLKDGIIHTASSAPNMTGTASSLSQVFSYQIYSIWSLAEQKEVSVKLKCLFKLLWAMLAILISEFNNNPSDAKERLLLLPTISFTLYWLCGLQDSKHFHFDAGAADDVSLLQLICSKITALVENVLQSYDASTLTSPSAAPLPEDLDLYQFLPFHECHAGLNFGLSSIRHDSDECYNRRCHRILLFAKQCITDPVVWLTSASAPKPIAPPLVSDAFKKQVMEVLDNNTSKYMSSQSFGFSPHSQEVKTSSGLNQQSPDSQQLPMSQSSASSGASSLQSREIPDLPVLVSMIPSESPDPGNSFTLGESGNSSSQVRSHFPPSDVIAQSSNASDMQDQSRPPARPVVLFQEASDYSPNRSHLDTSKAISNRNTNNPNSMNIDQPVVVASPFPSPDDFPNDMVSSPFPALDFHPTPQIINGNAFWNPLQYSENNQPLMITDASPTKVFWNSPQKYGNI